MQSNYDNRNSSASENTNFVIDGGIRNSQCRAMVTHDEILAELRRWISSGKVLQKEVAAELGIAPARITEMLKGTRKVQQREMPILAHYFGMDEGPDPSVRKIARIGMVPAGSLREALADTPNSVEVPANLPKGVFALEVDGESMNKIAPLGCDVIVDPNDKKLFSGDLYVVGNEAGEFTFKRFMQEPARLVPLSTDPAHKEIEIGSEPINIIGRVVSVSIGAEFLRRMA
ncbi:SOS-response transcriptional repressor LexA [Novosphingobium sp. PhB55]|uniref:LexA family protein n=1 Tax=Novosphingobium sp. PhB55 TaxID=2485106 RepID=UPI0010E6C97E|nr:LexA family transcriptional regulator [Novosphingobium sp. PhB55]TDW65374.1 SOS-response transcriptional repressor LexA [Novosphingobium sp. PhB55]